jgi:hypothetical protein
MARQLRAPYLVALSLLAVALAACGGASGGATGAPTAGVPAGTAGPAGTPGAAGTAPTGGEAAAIRACDLLSDADIEELTGSTVVEKLDNVADTIYANHCRWNLAAGEINLGIVRPGGRDFYDTRLGIVNGLVPVEGLAADTATFQELTGTIWAVKDDTLVDLFTIGVVAPDKDIVARVLANLAEM